MKSSNGWLHTREAEDHAAVGSMRLHISQLPPPGTDDVSDLLVSAQDARLKK